MQAAVAVVVAQHLFMHRWRMRRSSLIRDRKRQATSSLFRSRPMLEQKIVIKEAPMPVGTA
jgi:hypothetical protein